MAVVKFFKYQGTGNDFILLDNRKLEYEFLSSKDISLLCDRRLGIGADGLIKLNSNPEYSFSMAYYNSDGLMGSMCGNGGRCISAFAIKLGLGEGNKLAFNAYGIIYKAEIISSKDKESLVKLKMKDVDHISQLDGKSYLIDTGSPHYVEFVDNLDAIDILKQGRKIRYSNRFPLGVNVNFIQIIEQDLFRIRTYERGVEDETYSCGTGVCASAIAYIKKLKLESNHYCIKALSKGGELKVYANRELKDIFLEAKCNFVFEGEYNIKEL